MKKTFISVFLLLTLIFGCTQISYAHDKQAEHDGDLKYALFGSREKLLVGEEKAIFDAIANAAALTIDQFSPNDQTQWKEDVYSRLQENVQKLVHLKLPYSFEELDLNSKVSPDGKNITANSHRKYTHLSWSYRNYPNKEFWKTRKQLLLCTINWTLYHDKSLFLKVPWLSDMLYSPNEQCEAFGAAVYYIHILGDHIEGDKPEKLTNLEPLIQYRNLSTPGIIAELKEQLQIVFASQQSSWTYAAMMEEISDLEIKAERNCGTWGAVDTLEKCKINQQYAKELLDVLSAYLPKLLKNESFFSEHFKIS